MDSTGAAIRMTTLTQPSADALGLIVDEGLPISDIGAHAASRFLEARDEAGDLQGVIGLELRGTSGLVRSLIVAPAIRTHGLGARLLREVEALARAEGVAVLYLLTEGASPFFERHGFLTVDRSDAPPAVQDSAEFRELCGESAVFMRRTL